MDYQKRKEELEKEFNQKKSQLEAFQQKVQELSQELLRLQGKFQLLNELESSQAEEADKK